MTGMKLLARCSSCIVFTALCLWVGLCFAPGGTLQAQSRGTPGQFDFYLMNLSWAPEFCTHGSGAECTEGLGLVMHGLWPQFFTGKYPVDCSNDPPPPDLKKDLDLIPEIGLLQHEWSKHGTCSGVGGEQFFVLEHQAFHSLITPPALQGLKQQISLNPTQLLADFYQANPKFPKGSLALSCGNNFLTAVEVCLSKNGLAPVVCRGVSTCGATTLKIVAPGAPKLSRASRRHRHRG